MEKVVNKYIPNLVSVVIPTYKRSNSLVRAIKSVKAQSYPNIEIIVVNDNEKGDEYSLELYKKMNLFAEDRNIFLIEQEKHINGAAARNTGIRQAKGEYIAFLDDDDYWNTNKIEHQVKLLSNLDKSWGAVGCLTIHINNDKILYVTLPHKDGYIFNEVMQRTVRLGTSTLLLRRDAVDDAGHFDETLIRHQDIQFFGYFSKKYKIKLLKEYLYFMDHSDKTNRPNYYESQIIKQKFYNSTKPLIDSMNEKERAKFFIMNNFELGMIAWKSGNRKEGIKKICEIFRYPSTTLDSMNRVMERFQGKIFKNFYLKKYLPAMENRN